VSIFEGHSTYNLQYVAVILGVLTALFVIFTVGCFIDFLCRKKNREYVNRALVVSSILSVALACLTGLTWYSSTTNHEVVLGRTNMGTQIVSIPETKLSSWVSDNYGVAYAGTTGDGKIKISQLVDEKQVKRTCAVSLSHVSKTGGGMFNYDVQGQLSLQCDNSPKGAQYVTTLKPLHSEQKS
jgi:hypothetical protein